MYEALDRDDELTAMSIDSEKDSIKLELGPAGYARVGQDEEHDSDADDSIGLHATTSSSSSSLASHHDYEPLLLQSDHYFDQEIGTQHNPQTGDSTAHDYAEQGCSRQRKPRRTSRFAAGFIVVAVVALALCSVIVSVELGIFRRRAAAPLAHFVFNATLELTDGIAFSATQYSPLAPAINAPLNPTLSSSYFDMLDSRCLEAWVARGQFCHSNTANASVQLEVAWTWVNGSATSNRASTIGTLAGWREALSHEAGELEHVKAHGRGPQRAQRGRLGRRAVREQHQRRAEGGQVYRHFREHDELRYSIRSAYAALPVESITGLHLLVNDWPAYDVSSGPAASLAPSLSAGPAYLTNVSTALIAQVPAWLNLDVAQLADSTTDHTTVTPLLIHPLSSLFKQRPEVRVDRPYSKADQYADSAKAAQWRASVLPSFNSISVESQLAHLEPVSRDVDTLLTLCDDYMLTAPLTTSDIASPLTGTVIRLQRGFNVSPVKPNANDGRIAGPADGEWRGLGYSAWLLDQRFGTRQRPYISHVAKGISRAMLEEVSRVFDQELTETGTSRFRGMAPREVELWLLLYHYTIEKHREALLWSFIAARSDSNDDGELSREEQRELLASLGHGRDQPIAQDSVVIASVPRRATLDNLVKSFELAGLPQANHTLLEFSSMDGYAHFVTDQDRHAGRAGSWPAFQAGIEDDTPSPCQIQLTECFGDTFGHPNASSQRSEDVLRRVAYEKPLCGDCIIVQLMAQSGPLGLEAFLPPAQTLSNETFSVASSIDVIGRGKEWRTTRLTMPKRMGVSRRRQAMELITRYQYIVGSSPTRFVSIVSSGSAGRVLSSLDMGDPPAFVAINDDIGSRDTRDIDRAMKKWFESKWPTPTKWELAQM